jgi:asparagine N-glycosylation enzyme membrane subunit Stt3
MKPSLKPSTSLKLGSVFFTIFWIVAMLRWSGSMERANIVMTMICGVAAGYGWYRCMRWQVLRSSVLQRSGQGTPTV